MSFKIYMLLLAIVIPLSAIPLSDEPDGLISLNKHDLKEKTSLKKFPKKFSEDKKNYIILKKPDTTKNRFEFQQPNSNLNPLYRDNIQQPEDNIHQLPRAIVFSRYPNSASESHALLESDESFRQTVDFITKFLSELKSQNGATTREVRQLTDPLQLTIESGVNELGLTKMEMDLITPII